MRAAMKAEGGNGVNVEYPLPGAIWNAVLPAVHRVESGHPLGDVLAIA